jgi:hypothetical protein
MPSNTLAVGMLLKAQPRTFPFAICDGCVSLMQYLLGKASPFFPNFHRHDEFLCCQIY